MTETPIVARVGRYRIPVVGRHPSLVQFAAGARGAREAGVYCFWTAVLRRPLVNRQRFCTVRARAMQPPGERFERMNRERTTARHAQARREYGIWWTRIFRRGAGIAFIRPATELEIAAWLHGHRADAQYILSAMIGPPKPPQLAPPRPLTPSELAWETYG